MGITYQGDISTLLECIENLGDQHRADGSILLECAENAMQYTMFCYKLFMRCVGLPRKFLLEPGKHHMRMLLRVKYIIEHEFSLD